MSDGYDGMTMMTDDDGSMGAVSPREYVLEAMPEDVERYLHRCPVEACGHELVMTRSNERGSDKGSRSYRWVLGPDGLPVQELLRVRMPDSCWCGAPLPGEERISFDLWDVKGTRLLAMGETVSNDNPFCNLEHVAILEEIQEPVYELSRPRDEAVVS